MTGADLIFEASDHTYWMPPGRDGGQQVPNVTTILKAVGVSSNFQHVPSGTLEFRRQLGTAVHVDCHALDDDDLDWMTVDARVEPYVRAWATFRDNKGLVPMQRERRVYHPRFRYCGTLDGVFTFAFDRDDPRCVLIDIKIGDPDDAGAQFQTAAYAAAYLAEFPAERIDARWSVQLCPELATPYRVCEYESYLDFLKFQAFLTTFHEQPARRRRIR